MLMNYSKLSMFECLSLGCGRTDRQSKMGLGLHKQDAD